MTRIEIQRMMDLHDLDILPGAVLRNVLNDLPASVTTLNGNLVSGKVELRALRSRVVADDGHWTWADHIDIRPEATEHWPVEVLTLAALAAADVIADLADNPEEVRRGVLARLAPPLHGADIDGLPMCATKDEEARVTSLIAGITCEACRDAL